MTLKDALNASRIQAASGYRDGERICTVAFYPDKLLWLKGFEQNWEKEWKEVTDADMLVLEQLSFRPQGPKPDEMISQEIRDIFRASIEDDDDFMPMGETYD